MKQEKYAEALGHFELACRVNPASSVLRCCCGLALHKMGGLDEAVRQLKVCWYHVFHQSCVGTGQGVGSGLTAQLSRCGSVSTSGRMQPNLTWLGPAGGT